MNTDKNGVPLLPDYIEIDWEATLKEGYTGPPIEIKITLDDILKIEDELGQICKPIVPVPPKRN